MEELKLYNWYGETFDNILPAASGNIKAYKKQVYNIFSRQATKIKNQENIDKDLFLRARTKLQDNLKRNLDSHKVAYKNKVAVLKDSIKKLAFSESSVSLLNFEIKKIKHSLKDTQTYAKEFVYSLTKSADDLEDKVKNIKKLQITTKNEENELFKKYTIFNILKLYITTFNDFDFDISKLKDKLLPIEQVWIDKLGNKSSKFFKEIFDGIEEQRLSLLRRKNELERKYNQTYLKEKELYHREKQAIILESKQKILQLEYEYKSKVSELNSLNKHKKIESLAKIEEQKQLILAKEQKNKELFEKIKLKSVQEVQNIKSKYKEQKLFNKQRAKLQLNKDLYGFLSKRVTDLPKINFDFNNLSLEEITQKNVNTSNELLNYKNNSNNPLVKISFETYYSKTNILRNQYEFSLLLKSQLKYLIGKSKQSYTYEGKFNLEESKALKERFIDYRLTRLKYREEKILAKTKIFKLKESGELTKEKEKNTILFNEIKNKYNQNIKELKAKLQEKVISKQAYKNKLYEYKIEKKESINEVKLQSKSLANKEILKTIFWREFAETKVNKKLYESKITEAQKSIPIETMKNLRWLSLFLGIIFPGLSEVLLFKQYVKGIIMSIFSIFAWVLIIPFAFGFYWDQMGGIPGFSDLGKSLHDINKGILTDARLYLFGGVISVLLMVFVFIYFIVSGLGAYKVAKYLEYGSRPSKWSHTKRWLNTSGFPWVISILGWVLMLFIVATPIITSVLVSFTNYGYLHEAPGRTVDWVGLKNWGYWWEFRENKMFLSLGRVLGWTAIWTVASTFLPISFGIIIAVLTNSQRIRFKKIFRLIYILPWAIPAFVTLTFLKTAFKEGSDGYINTIMLSLNLIERPLNWLSEINSARVLVIIVQTWIAYAFIFMLVTGNLQSIPKDIYEAGSVDGAKGRQLFWYLTLPSLLLSISPMLIGQFVGAFNNFTTISIFTGGGPNFAESTIFGEASTDIIISWVYKLTTGAANFEGNQAFAAALTTLAAIFSIAVGARGFIKSMSRRD
ncbi:ABC transporter permease subunit [Mycoplasmopsis felis]|uniref:ABC transporter permease subunit n=1 Tax=Mycoplasmopsis felis TaxID=33923 RepID=UPI003A4DBF85